MTAPHATVVEQRRTVGTVRVVDIACPHGDHTHTIGIAGGLEVFVCLHTQRAYTVDHARESS